MSRSIVIERPDLFTAPPETREFTKKTGAAAHLDAASAPAVILVRGTHMSGGQEPWADPGSPFRVQVLEPAGLVVAANVYGPERLWNPKPDWQRIGDELAPYLNMRAFSILSHSHGQQPAALAIAQSQAVAWVSVSGPVRKDMLPVYAAAAERTERIVRTFDPAGDWTGWGGEWFSRTAACVWAPKLRPFPGLPPHVENLPAAGAGHSALLYDAAYFDMARALLVPPLMGEHRPVAA